MRKTRGMATAEQKLNVVAGMIAWYHPILIWALNRCENTPQALIQLIKDKSNVYVLEADSLNEGKKTKKE